MNTKTEDYKEPMMSQVTEKLRRVQDCVSNTAKNVSNVTDEYVHENPWKTIAVVAIAACVVGWFLNAGRD
jgi:ElaB/YqjD/DUF883 family membrane-anchored ribosome-binding protein